ncbi:MAG: chromophore lyase CpcT/CpeT [Planctomycetota bacterium]|nr:chromophore lyase CpcT/CpeT [Planctomycetota bacterium]
MRHTLAAIVLGFASAACSTTPSSRSQVDELAAWMTGSFSSSAQSAADKDYRDIRLHMAPIWTARDDGRWLYVEQAVAEKQEKPYRQRVYRVHAEDHGLVSDVYELPGNPLDYAGAWKDATRLKDVKPETLMPRTGCSIRLQRLPDGSYSGATEHGACPSELNGAKFATSEVVITPHLLASWDRGFDASGKQVWGAEKGAYQFVKE